MSTGELTVVLSSTERRRLDVLADELARDNPRLARALAGRRYRLGRALARSTCRQDAHRRTLYYLAIALTACAAPLLVIGLMLLQPILIALGAAAIINGPALLLLQQLRHARARPSNPDGYIDTS